MGKTVRGRQKRGGWRENRHREEKRKHFGKGKDRFRFNPNDTYVKGE